MINVEKEEIIPVAGKLALTKEEFTEKYIETGFSGKMIMNTIPCAFLEENKCNVYEERFNECREFPHLHKPNFNKRLFATLIHYSICPIIFNVVEALKIETGFFIEESSLISNQAE